MTYHPELQDAVVDEESESPLKSSEVSHDGPCRVEEGSGGRREPSGHQTESQEESDNGKIEDDDPEVTILSQEELTRRKFQGLKMTKRNASNKVAHEMRFDLMGATEYSSRDFSEGGLVRVSSETPLSSEVPVEEVVTRRPRRVTTPVVYAPSGPQPNWLSPPSRQPSIQCVSPGRTLGAMQGACRKDNKMSRDLSAPAQKRTIPKSGRFQVAKNARRTEEDETAMSSGQRTERTGKEMPIEEAKNKLRVAKNKSMQVTERKSQKRYDVKNQKAHERESNRQSVVQRKRRREPENALKPSKSHRWRAPNEEMQDHGRVYGTREEEHMILLSSSEMTPSRGSDTKGSLKVTNGSSGGKDQSHCEDPLDSALSVETGEERSEIGYDRRTMGEDDILQSDNSKQKSRDSDNGEGSLDMEMPYPLSLNQNLEIKWLGKQAGSLKKTRGLDRSSACVEAGGSREGKLQSLSNSPKRVSVNRGLGLMDRIGVTKVQSQCAGSTTSTRQRASVTVNKILEQEAAQEAGRHERSQKSQGTPSLRRGGSAPPAGKMHGDAAKRSLRKKRLKRGRRQNDDCSYFARSNDGCQSERKQPKRMVKRIQERLFDDEMWSDCVAPGDDSMDSERKNPVRITKGRLTQEMMDEPMGLDSSANHSNESNPQTTLTQCHRCKSLEKFVVQCVEPNHAFCHMCVEFALGVSFSEMNTNRKSWWRDGCPICVGTCPCPSCKQERNCYQCAPEMLSRSRSVTVNNLLDRSSGGRHDSHNKQYRTKLKRGQAKPHPPQKLKRFRHEDFTVSDYEEHVIRNQEPVIIEGVGDRFSPMWSINWLKENYGETCVNVRYQGYKESDVEGPYCVLKDTKKRLNWWIENSGSDPSDHSDPDYDLRWNVRDNSCARISRYAKDFAFGESVPEWSKDFPQHLPEYIKIGGKHDLMRYPDNKFRPIVLMAYLGEHGTRTPIHIDRLNTVAFNIHVDGSGVKRWWIVHHEDAKMVREEIARRGRSLLMDDYWFPPCQLRSMGVRYWEFDQKMGDMVLIGPGCPHEVLNMGNKGDLSMAIAANVIHPSSLHLTWSMCQEMRKNKVPSIYRIKVCVFFGVKCELQTLTSTHSSLDDRLLAVRDLQALYPCFEEMVEEENAHAIVEKMSPIPLPCLYREDDDKFTLVCDECGTDIFNRRIHCPTLGREDGLDYCLQCFEEMLQTMRAPLFAPIELRAHIQMAHLTALKESAKQYLDRAEAYKKDVEADRDARMVEIEKGKRSEAAVTSRACPTNSSPTCVQKHATKPRCSDAGGSVSWIGMGNGTNAMAHGSEDAFGKHSAVFVGTRLNTCPPRVPMKLRGVAAQPNARSSDTARKACFNEPPQRGVARGLA